MNEALYATTDQIYAQKQVSLNRYNRYIFWKSGLLTPSQAQWTQRILPHGNPNSNIEYMVNYKKYNIDVHRNHPKFPFNNLDQYCTDLLNSSRSYSSKDILSAKYQTYILVKEGDEENLYIHYVDFDTKVELYLKQGATDILNAKLLLSLLGIGKIGRCAEEMSKIFDSTAPLRLGQATLAEFRKIYGKLKSIHSNGTVAWDAYKELIKFFDKFPTRTRVIKHVKCCVWNTITNSFEPYLYPNPYKKFTNQLGKIDGLFVELSKSNDSTPNHTSIKSPIPKLSPIKSSKQSKIRQLARTKESQKQLAQFKSKSNQNNSNRNNGANNSNSKSGKTKRGNKATTNGADGDSSEDENQNNNKNDVSDGNASDSEGDSSENENKRKRLKRRRKLKKKKGSSNNNNNNNNNSEDDRSDIESSESNGKSDSYTEEPPIKRQKLAKVKIL